MASFHFADVGQRVGLLGAGGIAAGIPPSGVDDGYALVLLFDQFGDVSGDFAVVIGMTDDLQNVHFIPAVWFGIGRSLLTLGVWNCENRDEEEKKKTRVVHLSKDPLFTTKDTKELGHTLCLSVLCGDRNYG